MSFVPTSIDTGFSLIPLCVVKFTKQTELHSNCLPEQCLKKGGQICLNPKLYDHLQNHKKAVLDKKSCFGLSDETDQYHLNQALKHPILQSSKDVLRFFARANVYRLRYMKHQEDGKKLVEKIISELSSFFRTFGSIWGAPYSDHQHSYLQFFRMLCSKCEDSSVGGIYRLFDLFEGTKFSLEKSLPYHLHLALLFAFGHGTSKGPELRSINQLVSKIQFYLSFAEDVLKGSLANLPPDQRIKELASEWLGQIVNQLWDGYLSAASVIQNNQSSILNHNPRIIDSIERLYSQQNSRFQASHIIYQLKQDLSRPLVLPAFNCAGALKKSRFECEFSAAYHPFKHADATYKFFGRKYVPTALKEYQFWRPETFAEYAHCSMKEYCDVIHHVIEESPLPEAQPAQFGSGVTCKFKTTRKIGVKIHSFSVITMVYSHGVSYMLTCFDK